MCSNEATLGGLMDGFRMENGYQKDQTMSRSLELSAPFPILQEESPVIEIMLNHSYVMKHPLKNIPTLWGWKGF